MVEKNIAEKFKREIVNVNDIDMSYIQLGNPESEKSIVIIHGSTFSALAMVPYGELYVKDGYNVILVDTPGHYGILAKSKAVFSELTDSVANFMKVLIEDGKLSNKSEVHGWSLGGSICFDLAIRHSEIVKSIGIIDGSSNWHGLDLGHITDYENKLDAVTKLANDLKSTAVSQEAVNKYVLEYPFTLAPVEACNNDFIIDKVLNVDDRLSDIDVPVYIFYGSIDTLTTIEKQNEILSKLKDGKLFVAEGYGHMAVLEDPKTVYNAFEEMK